MKISNIFMLKMINTFNFNLDLYNSNYIYIFIIF